MQKLWQHLWNEAPRDEIGRHKAPKEKSKARGAGEGPDSPFFHQRMRGKGSNGRLDRHRALCVCPGLEAHRGSKTKRHNQRIV